jgi:hypothetical protein
MVDDAAGGILVSRVGNLQQDRLPAAEISAMVSEGAAGLIISDTSDRAVSKGLLRPIDN